MTNTYNASEIPTLENFDNSPAWYDAKYGKDGWHDADYCNDEECRRAHRHDANCRCDDCSADDER